MTDSLQQDVELSWVGDDICGVVAKSLWQQNISRTSASKYVK